MIPEITLSFGFIHRELLISKKLLPNKVKITDWVIIKKKL